MREPINFQRAHRRRFRTVRKLLLGAIGLSGLLMPLAAQELPAATLADCDVAGFQSVLVAAPGGSALAARAVWLNGQVLRWTQVQPAARFRLLHSARGAIIARNGSAASGADGALDLSVSTAALPPAVAERFRYVPAGIELAVAESDLTRMASLHRQQLVVVREDAQGRVLDASRLQSAGALDALFASAQQATQLGVHSTLRQAQFRLWAPTAQRVALCVYEQPGSAAAALVAMDGDVGSGVWHARLKQDRRGQYYRYLVDVWAPGVGMVRNPVTDPYSISLSADARRSYIGHLDDAALKPAAWNAKYAPRRLAANTDMVIYELHVRDFSINDASVDAAQRGKYLAFRDADSAGMRHLKALADAGLTDIHLLPVFDFATVPEQGCTSPQPGGAADSESQQASVEAMKSADCFNWGYDPLHFNAPEGSYASDANDGALRILEFRSMVESLHQAGLRVGMDVVYNHTSASGQNARSVLDRIVPGYYQRLNANGDVETSTCCANTATENAMMAKLMIDSVVLWARHYRIDSFRFDLMGHQPRAVMEQLRDRLNGEVGREVQLLGEGWNFGEIANGARFVQASQLSLNGSGIATFSDRARDAVRGGGAGDGGIDQMRRQGYINGLYYAPNATSNGVHRASDLLQSADMVRVGLAGSLRDYPLRNYLGAEVLLEQISYGGNQPAGYVREPDEVVNYVENHDNQTLFDINVFKLPTTTSRADRARVQMLGAAINAFSQGIAYFHAGIDTLRSKSMDRNSYDSGDWFNRIDWTGQDNYFGTGLPPRQDNAPSWSLMRPLLADPAIKPGPAEIVWTRDVFRDLLRIRASSSLLRLRSAADIKQRLRLLNTGPDQVATVLVGHINGQGYADAGFAELLYLINVDPEARAVVLPTERNKAYALHPVQAATGAADTRPRTSARYEADSGRFTVPARTAVVYVID